MKNKGAVAAGHPLTVDTAIQVLQEGGNAYDAIIAAHFTACVVEPVLASLGGGGFMLAQTAEGSHRLYDFFVQTPARKLALEDIDFKPIQADFGVAIQEFHVGLGAAATPGAVKGLFEIHRELATMPMQVLAEPAVNHARQGVEVNEFQGYIFDIVSPILMASKESAAIYSDEGGERVLGVHDRFRCEQLSDLLQALATEGDELFYRGEVADTIVRQSQTDGGQLDRQDLASYQVKVREPLRIGFRDHQLLTNPPPSSGGILIAFALQLWECLVDGDIDYAGIEHLELLAETMAATNQMRLEAHLSEPQMLAENSLFDKQMLDRYRKQVLGRARSVRGTTHISVIDQWHNVASMTVSNGEGCGHIVPGTGVMLNNMLGEEDLNPGGFQRWKEDQRMTSMMAPTIINHRSGSLVALGSGGSNRIRTALLQTILNLLEFDQGLERSVCHPRIHYENRLLNLEAGFSSAVIESLVRRYPDYKIWDDINLFFGGVNAVMSAHDRYEAVGDARRGGAGECL